jgi:hypothetical protein
MKPQRQLIEHCPEEGRYGDCHRTCIAAILDLDAANVPHFCDYGPENAPPIGHPDHFATKQDAWLGAFGLSTFTVAYAGSASLDEVMGWTSKQSPSVPLILTGQSSLGSNHSVVVLNGQIVCDPSGNGIVGPTLENTWELTAIAAISGRPLPRYAQPCADHEYIQSDCQDCGKLELA